VNPKNSVQLLVFLALCQLVSGCGRFISPTIVPSLPAQDPTELGITPSPSLVETPNSTLPSTFTTPSLTPQEVNELLLQLYVDNARCLLPCYWNIIPGKTTWPDASAFLSTIGQVKGPGGTSKVPSYGVVFSAEVDNPMGGFMPIFWVKDEVVKAIGINSSWVNQDFDYSLSGLLQSFGIPEEIWIRPVSESSTDQPYYYLVLFYPSKGILVNSLGNAETKDQHLVVCPQDIFSRSPYPPQLLLWNPEEQLVFENLGERLVDDDLGWVMSEYRLLHDITSNNMTNVEFYDIYSEPNTDICMDVLPLR
jgi:hypothetical protein